MISWLDFCANKTSEFFLANYTSVFSWSVPEFIDPSENNPIKTLIFSHTVYKYGHQDSMISWLDLLEFFLTNQTSLSNQDFLNTGLLSSIVVRDVKEFST
jgi:hypothetical protein